MPVKTRQGAIVAEAWQPMHDIFKKTRVPPNACILNNETSQELMAAFTINDIKCLLVLHINIESTL